MDPRQEILNQQRRRHQNLLRQEERDKRQTRSTYYAGQGANGQPLVRATGGAAVPVRSLSNIQPEIGQQGRSDGRGFDVGVRRSSPEKLRRKTPLDIIFLSSYLFGENAYTGTAIYSQKLGGLSIENSSGTPAIHRLNDFSGRSELDFYYIDRQTNQALIKKVDLSDFTETLILIINIDPQLPGVDIRFINDLAIVINFNADYRGNLGPQEKVAVVAYLKSIDPPPFEYSAQAKGDTISILSGNVAISGNPSVFISYEKTSYSDLFSYLLGFDKKGNYILYEPENINNGNESVNRYIVKSNNVTYDLYLGSNVFDGYPANLYLAKFSELGDLNFYAIDEYTNTRKIHIVRIVNVGGNFSAGQFKDIFIPRQAKNSVVFVNLPNTALYNTGRNLIP